MKASAGIKVWKIHHPSIHVIRTHSWHTIISTRYDNKLLQFDRTCSTVKKFEIIVIIYVYKKFLQCTMGEIGLLNVTQKYFITFFCFGTTLKFNYLLCGYSYWRVNYIFVMATNLTIMQQFLTLFNPILAKWHLFAHSAMSPCTQAKTRSPAQLLG